MNELNQSVIMFNIFRHRNWACSTVWLHMDFTKLDQHLPDGYVNRALNSWIPASSVKHFIDGTASDLRNSVEIVNLIVIPNIDLVNPRLTFFSGSVSFIPNFYVLILDGKWGKLYFHSRPDTVALLTNMIALKYINFSGTNFKLDIEWRIGSMQPNFKTIFRPQLQYGNVDIYMIQIISAKLNFTLKDDNTCGHTRSYQCMITRNARFESYGHTDYLNFVEILTDFESFNFISCNTVNHLDFSIYAQPFQTWVWGWLAISILTVTFVTDILARLKGLKIPTSLLFVVGLLIDEGGLISEKLLDIQVFRRYICFLLLLSTVITNAYIGIFINYLIEPLSASRFEIFEDIFLDEFTNITEEQYQTRLDDRGKLDARVNDVNFSVQNDWTKFAETASITLLQTFQDVYNGCPYCSINYPFRNFIDKQASTKSSSKFETQLLYHLQNLRVRWFPSEMLRRLYEVVKGNEVMAWTEAELVGCGRAVFITAKSGLKSYLNYLQKHYPSLDFYLGQEAIFPVPFGVFFQTSIHSRVPGKFKNLMESGIYSKVTDWFGVNRLSKLRHSTHMVDVNVVGRINGNLQSVFYIFLIIKLGAIISFLVEIKLPNFKRLLIRLRVKWATYGTKQKTRRNFCRLRKNETNFK